MNLAHEILEHPGEDDPAIAEARERWATACVARDHFARLAREALADWARLERERGK